MIYTKEKVVSETEEREVWTNLNQGEVYVDLWDPYTPNIRKSHRIGPGERVSMTSEERRFNQTKVPKGPGTEFDLFTNGTLTPVKLVDTAADFEEIALSPNVKSESDLREMFAQSITAFKKSIAEIDNVRLLDRLAELAEEDGIEASLAQSKAIAAQREKVGPDLELERNLGDQTTKTLKETKLSQL